MANETIVVFFNSDLTLTINLSNSKPLLYEKFHKNKSYLIFGLAILFICNTTTILAQWTCGDILLDERDGQSYSTVKIGEQCWMAKNLNYGTYIASNGGGSLTHDDGIVEKYCWNNNPDNCDNSTAHPGGYYEYYEAVQYYSGQPTEPVQGACPDGWHLPAKTEFAELITHLGGTSVAGAALKAGGSLGFEGVIAGWRCTSGGSFLTLFPKGFWWSSTNYNTNEAWYMDIDNTNPYASQTHYGKSLGFNIRCVKNETSTSINQIKNDEIFKINSVVNSGNKLTVNFSGIPNSTFHLKVSDLNGRQVFATNKASATKKCTIEINTQGFSDSIYLLTIFNGDKTVSKKIMIR